MLSYFLTISSLLLFPTDARTGLDSNLLIGNVDGKRTFAKGVLRSTKSGDATLWVVVIAVDAKRLRERGRFRVGIGLASTARVECVNFRGGSRKQVFAKIAWNAPIVAVLDYDGRSIRNIYRPLGGRVYASPVKTRGGRWELREAWPVRQWEDYPDLGEGWLTKGNTVARLLHWNGRQFVPDHPGRTRIKRANVRRLQKPPLGTWLAK